MGKTITLPSAPGTAELYGKAVTALLPKGSIKQI